ncbi:hypothetical protein HDU92_006659 [Lobulomyces angularis]|nr:hypothetical protein HDU92_006659 [Lobulomyces angularis]
MKKYIDAKTSTYSAQDFATSPFFNSNTLFYIRISNLLYMVVILAVHFAINGLKNKLYSIFFLTNLSYFGIICYLITVTKLTHDYNRQQKNCKDSVLPEESCKQEETESSVKSSTFEVTKEQGFWGFVNFTDFEIKTDPYTIFMNINVHGLGLTFMIFEFLINNIHLHYTMFPGPMICALLYVGYALTFHAISGLWVYPVMDYTRKGWYFYYFGTILGVLLVFFFMVFMHKLRDRLREKYLKN